MNLATCGRKSTCSTATSFVSPAGVPAASYESVAQPNWITPSYVFSIPIRHACRRVALPTQRTSRPVASGSSVPVCPTFLIFARRRNFSTASWLVMPAFLSTSRSPSTRGDSGGRGMARNDTSLEEVVEQRYDALAQRSEERQRRELDEAHGDVERGPGEALALSLPRRLVVDPEEDEAELVEPEEARQELFEVLRHFGP